MPKKASAQQRADAGLGGLHQHEAAALGSPDWTCVRSSCSPEASSCLSHAAVLCRGSLGRSGLTKSEAAPHCSGLHKHLVGPGSNLTGFRGAIADFARLPSFAQYHGAGRIPNQSATQTPHIIARRIRHKSRKWPWAIRRISAASKTGRRQPRCWTSLDCLRTAITIFDPDGRLLYANAHLNYLFRSFPPHDTPDRQDL